MDHDRPDDHSISGRQKGALIVLYCGGVVSTVFTGLRVVSRRLTGSKLWWDDYIAILSGIFAWPVYITCILGIQYGMGKRIAEISLKQAEKIAFVAFFHQLAYTISYNLLFVTLLALYFRIFPNRRLHLASLCMGILVTVFCLINEIIIIFQCTPTRFYWDKSIPGGHCIHQSLCYFINSTITMIQVLVIVFLPVPVLWRLQMPLNKRIKTIIAFTVGVFIAVTAIARLVYIIKISNLDPVYSFLKPVIWSGLEISVGVTSASMASVMPIYRALFGKKASSSTPSDGTYGKSTNDGFSKLARSKKSNGTIDTEDGFGLPELVLPPNTSRTVKDDGDQARLVGDVKSSERISVSRV